MTEAPQRERRSSLLYDQWMESIGIPIHRGHYQADLRTLELGWWEERGCNAAFLQMKGMEGVSEARIVEIPPGVTLPPLKMAICETIYALSGPGRAQILLLGYGSMRLLEGDRKGAFEASYARVDNLFDPMMPLGDLNGWLCRLHDQEDRSRLRLAYSCQRCE